MRFRNPQQHHLSMKRWSRTVDSKIAVRRWTAIILLSILVQPAQAVGSTDPTDVATSAIEFGGSVGKLLWVSVNDHRAVTRSDANRYMSLAAQVKEQIDLGRASSSLVKANFNVIGTTLVYGAAVDPEPLSKAVSGVAAWGAKKTGDAIGQLVIEQSENQARAILAQGLKNSGLTDVQLKSMTADDLRSRVGDLKVGGQTLRETLKDDPGSLDMLQANATDIATNIGVEALARSEGTASDVKTIQKELANTKKEIADFQDQVNTHLDAINTRLSSVEDATNLANQKLDALRSQVQGQSKAMQTLAQISYSGWSTEQKLQAVEGGLFPELTTEQKTALATSLKADQARENAIVDLQQAAQDFGNLAAIAGHIGLPSDIVTGLQGAQIVATGVTKFATGDILGGLSSITSLVGLGAPDAEAVHYAAMMKYLEQQFAEVNKKLDKIIDLQVQTLRAIATLADEQKEFRKEVLGQLDRIESIVLRNEKLTQAVLLNQWQKCYALINGTSLNGQFTIPTRDVLVGVVGNPNISDYATHCYSQMAGFLDAYVKPAKWSGQIIDADSFPADAIPADPTLQSSWSAFQSQRINTYKTARDFVFQALSQSSVPPAAILARFSQPVVDTSFADQLSSAIDAPATANRLSSFKCNESDVLSPPLRDLLCFGIVPGAANPPASNRWQDMLGASLIGPYSTGLIDTGIALSTIVDFSRNDGRGTFVFVKPKVIENFYRDGSTPQLRQALEEHKGADLLTKMRWLTEGYVLQQSVAYGDYTAQLVERSLYDPSTRSLNTDPKVMTDVVKQKALLAMRTNPTLARNVVLLAMRHAIADSLGGMDKAEAEQFRQTYYALALTAFTGPQACGGSTYAREKLSEMFPSWRFEYWVTSDQKKQDPSLDKCSTEFLPDAAGPAPQLPARGSGVGVSLADFYVLAPSPIELSTGQFEQSDSLRLALSYRDHLNQVIIDRDIGSTVRSVAGSDAEAQAVVGTLAFELLNEGWGWQNRIKSQ
ncbi:hypothetical protein [Edaphobacter sp. DSM 109919]|uniref:Uncharacterized protein n=1 Tax=Edaphobacter paludis TaxID=3035702 RepID=A0AAU7CV01_9BACT